MPIGAIMSDQKTTAPTPPAAVVGVIPAAEAAPTVGCVRIYLHQLDTFPATSGEVVELCEVIHSLRQHLENEDVHEHRPFLSAFAVLASDFLAAGCELLTAAQLGAFFSAVRILTDFFLSGLEKGHGGLPQGFLTRDFLCPLSAFCSGTPSLEKREQTALVNVLKECATPPYISLCSESSPKHKDKDAAATAASLEGSHKLLSDLNRPQTDLTPFLLDQLLTPVEKDVQFSTDSSGTDSSGDNLGGSRSRLIRLSFTTKNIQYLHSRNAGDVLIDLCTGLPHLATYIGQWNDATSGEGTCVPASYAEAVAHRQTFQELVAEISTCWKALTLPVLEPLTANRISKICKIVMGCLLASVSVSTTQSILSLSTNLNNSGSSGANSALFARLNSSKEEELDMCAIEIIEKSLELFNATMSLVRESTRAGGHILQNFTTMGAWVLTTGLWVQLTNTSQVADRKDSKSKESAAVAGRTNLIKAQQGFGVLSVALGSQALSLTAALLEDLAVEVCTENQQQQGRVEPATFDLFHPFMATQRVALIFNSVPFVQLLFNIAVISYRKSCNLKCILDRAMPNKTISRKGGNDATEMKIASAMEDIEEDSCSEDDDDRNSYNNEDYLNEAIVDEDEDEDNDDDSEPLLGKWFEETLFPPEESSKSNMDTNDNDERDLQDGTGVLLVPDKGEPSGFISLASHIFIFLNKHILTSESSYVRSYIQSRLSEQQLQILANITRDLDYETAQPNKMEYHLASLYSEFSNALSSFTHNVLAYGLLTEKLQNSLLSQLSVSPWQSDRDWPLRVYPRTLAVLAQVLLIRQNQEGVLHASKQTNVYILIWERVLATLTKHAIVPEVDQADLNVEHVQLLLFFFHALGLMQKKQVLLQTASSIVQVSKVVDSRKLLKSSQIMHISRLVLLFEYLMRNLYEPPKELMDQVQHNIFRRYQNKSVLCVAAKYVAFKDGETSADKIYREEDEPRFYNLFRVPDLPAAVQEIPKLDGLASSFLLGTVDAIHYNQIYDGLVTLLQVVHQADLKREEEDDSEAMSATHYCFTLVWRMLQSLPPSVEFLENVVSLQAINMSPCTLLHSLVLCPRTGHKVLGAWIKDSLVKQGQTTAKAENLLKNVSTTINCLSYDVKMFTQLLKLVQENDSMSSNRRYRGSFDPTPDFMHLLLLDAIMGKVQISLDGLLAGGKGGPDVDKTGNSNPEVLAESVAAAHDLVPMIVQLLEGFLDCCKSILLSNLGADGTQPPVNDATKLALANCLAVSGSKCQKFSSLSAAINGHFPAALQNKIQEWNETSLLGFPPTTSWRNNSSASSPDSLPYEPFLNIMIKTHIAAVTATPNRHNMKTLKHCLYSAARFAGDLFVSFPDPLVQAELAQVLFPLVADGCAENLSDLTALTLQPVLASDDKFTSMAYMHVLQNTFGVLLNVDEYQTSYFNEKILQEIVEFLEKMLDQETGRLVLDAFFSERPEYELVQILLTITSPSLSSKYVAKVLQMFVRLFEIFEKNPTEPSIQRLCSSLVRLSQIPPSELEIWLEHLVQGSATANGHALAIADSNLAFLQALSNILVLDDSPISEDVALVILKSLIPLASGAISLPTENSSFASILTVMNKLASAGSGSGHLKLFRSCNEWLEICRNYLVQKNVIEKLEDGIGSGKHCSMVENSCHLLGYLCEILSSLQLCFENEQGPLPLTMFRPSSPTDGENHLDTESEWADDLQVEDDDSGGEEDSDDDSLCNKLCTYTQTQKEFMNQHWYHCHTCKMVDGIGVCSICAKVCHADHDISYSKFGSFFCDCGAREDGACIALVKRTPNYLASASVAAVRDERNKASSNATSGLESMLASSLRKRPQSPSLAPIDFKRNLNLSSGKSLAIKLSAFKDVLLEKLKHASVALDVLHLMYSLIPVIEATGEKYSSVGRLAKIQAALNTLHGSSKNIEYFYSDQLMNPTLGSQEGAFENVRMSYTGDQGQTIRHLMTANLLRRVVMCCLSSGPGGKRQHLAVAHEKGRITVLQLSALLKQADSSQKKLTLTRLTSAPVPFAVLSVVSNPVNEDYLAVTGLKDVHILTLNVSGAVTDQLVLHPQLDANNFIIKSLWVPGSQTQLALVTADFVKIYDLSIDVLSPQYFFLVPSGKVRDCTLAFMEDGKKYVMIMSSAGHIYLESLSEESLAQHGPFYVTNIMDVHHEDLQDSSEQIGGGGVSIFYYHTLQLLFFSYVHGKSYMAPLRVISDELAQVFNIKVEAKSTNGSNSAKNNVQQQPLCQWAEISSHPGLLTAFLQTSNNPVILMIKPDSVTVQEIKVGSKSKIIDIVAIRHSVVNHEQKTTLILLCEDGSLKIYMAGVEQTNFWLSRSMHLHPMSSVMQAKPPRKKKAQKILHASGAVTFPVDFFESCSPLSDIEFGGSDILQVYNVQQIKHRFQTSGLYIANTKPNGFTLEITNNDHNQVIVGFRVMLGSQDTTRLPSSIEVFGRSLSISGVTRARWFDIPLARDESLQQADKKLSVSFGASLDPSGVSIVDSVQVYGKSKDNFGWPEDHEETAGNGSATVPSASGAGNGVAEPDNLEISPAPLTPVERLVAGSLEVLNDYFKLATFASIDDMTHLKKMAIDLLSDIISMPTSKVVEQLTNLVLGSLTQTKTAYYNHKDQVALKCVMSDLKEIKEIENAGNDSRVENFYRLILTARAIAVARPQNLLRFTESPADATSTKPEDKHKFMLQLMNWFWHLLASRPVNALVGTLGQPGITHVEATVQALIDIFHAFTTVEPGAIPFASQLYAQLLMAGEPSVSFAAKQGLIRALRPRVKRRRIFIPPTPRCSSPPQRQHSRTLDLSSSDSSNQFGAQFREAAQDYHMQPPTPDMEAALNVGPGGIQLGGIAGNLDALLPHAGGGAGNLPNVLDDMAVDDEAMVELAIALSLQEQGGEEGLQQGLRGLQHGLEQLVNLGPDLPGLQGLAGMLGGAIANLPRGNHQQEAGPRGGQEPGHYSDAMPSAPGSDDEGSMPAMDGSALRTPPVEPDQVSAAGSEESGGSVNESITGEQVVSDRSSAYEAETPGGVNTTRNSNTVEETYNVPEEESELELSNIRLHSLRLIILEHLLNYIPQLRDIGGVRSIPYMQVVLMLTTDLDESNEKDRKILDRLLTTLVSELNFNQTSDELICQRSNLSEMRLVVLRLFSVLMSRSKSWQGISRIASHQASADSGSSFVSQNTAMALVKSGCVEHCLAVLSNLLGYWKTKVTEDSNSPKVSSPLLKSQLLQSPPDMSPFFLKQYVKGHAHDVFEAFPQLLTEMTLRLPYQMKKISENIKEGGSQAVFDDRWFHCLCEYMMMTNQTPYVRRQVRKLLLYICGTKEKYRELRDIHALGSHIRAVKKIVAQDPESSKPDFAAVATVVMNFSYDTLLLLIEHLKACVDVSTSRTKNWQKFCLQDESVLSFLFQISLSLDDGVSPIILQLLQGALCSPPQTVTVAATSPVASSSSRTFRFGKALHTSKSGRGEKSKLEEVVEENDSYSQKLVHQVLRTVNRDLLLSRFIEKFLLECNATVVRWQAHALIVTLQRNSREKEQEEIVDILWKLWHQLPLHGRKAAQFVDLLGYFSMKMAKVAAYVHEAVEVLKTQNIILANHANVQIYGSLSHLVDFSGYYLESDPCLVCNNPEVPYSYLKLSSLKTETKYTTTTHIVKLSSSHSISKITLRIGDLKRQKMVRTINIYYNNRSVQAVVELKNKPTMWHKARKVALTAGQTDIKVEFPLPIVACNLMIEYSDFYENIQASSETLQCPRCSASVSANPGVCGNCGENVFQCHKCRSINYDEKDPFLCNACGFCKYAKFEYTLTCRPCCGVDPIENEEDRKKAIQSINNLLDKADKVYKQLIGNRPHLETMLLKVSESFEADNTRVSNVGGAAMATAGSGGPPVAMHGSSYVNIHIQQLAQKYCGDCKTSFEELSKIIQKVTTTRKELLSFDNGRKRLNRALSHEINPAGSSASRSTGKCYGCAAASVEHCLTLLRALATNPRSRNLLLDQGIIPELLEHNLRRGSQSIRCEVRKLISFLTKDNLEATNHLNQLLYNRISLAMKGQNAYPDLVESVRHEMSLLAYTVQREDSCWEDRLKCVFRLFLLATKDGKPTPTITECITLPCLRILQGLVRPTIKLRKGKDDKDREPATEYYRDLAVNVQKWLDGEPQHCFKAWETRAAKPSVNLVKKERKEEAHKLYLARKFFVRWFEKTFRKVTYPLQLLQSSWLKSVLFNPTSKSARQVACTMVESFCNVHDRKKDVIELMTSYLDELCTAGEAASEFCALYQRLISSDHWQFYLAIKGTLGHIAELITNEIDQLNELERTTLSSDLAQGFALKTLVEILANFVSMEKIKSTYKSRLVSNVLHGYLSLRRLVVQRTKLVDQTQEKLLELLEDMTTGTEEETKAFMSVCVQTIQRYPQDDQLTPVFIFERLCNIIYPEEADTGEFFLMLEKDAQQEDFLQGRMLGNPYSSNDSDLGPLMREIKNKICRDCELVALLEDDNGMELLVNNKIISLDLPVKDVYQKIWLPDAQEGEPMRIIYRMRGLLGDATEEFIETLENKDSDDQDDEEVYRLANVMSDCDGLEVMLARMESVTDIHYSTHLLAVLLKLFNFCIKVKRNREKLLDPQLRTIPVLLQCLKLFLDSGEIHSTSTASGPSLSELILHIMECLLVEAASKHSTIGNYIEFASAGISMRDIEALLEHAVQLKSGTELHQILMRVLPFLTYGNGDKMTLVVKHFDDVLRFDEFDVEHGPEKEAKMQAFVALCDGIERKQIGNTMKSQMLELGIVDKCIKYIKKNAPLISSTLLKNDDQRWKDFVTKPSLRYILQTLSGLAVQHSPTQMLIADHCIPLLHQMEQVSSDEHVGSLAEAVLEAMTGCPEAENKVKLSRDQTKTEKKRLAMAMRAKQLEAFGLKANEQGQVKADSSLLQKFVGIAEESGLSCNICREGYKFQPNKVLAIYTFTMPCYVEEAEPTARKTMGYTTVSHFNLVHVDCHSAAVRQARGRDEWESALLQNANTKCNGLLPLWGPSVPESAFASCLVRHNNYLSEATNHRDIGYQSTTHDMKLLLMRFAQDRSFSEETGGGGPQSNMHLVPYLLHMALYVLNTTRSAAREEKNLKAFLDQPREKWIDSCYLAEGPLYYTVISLLVLSPNRWKTIRVRLLQRLLLSAHLRAVSPRPPKTLEDRAAKNYATYKKTILFFALVDQLYSLVFAGVPTNDEDWSGQLADWIRNNDDELLKLTSKALSTFQDDLLPATSVDEIVDVCGLLDDIPSPASFLLEILSLVP